MGTKSPAGEAVGVGAAAGRATGTGAAAGARVGVGVGVGAGDGDDAFALGAGGFGGTRVTPLHCLQRIFLPASLLETLKIFWQCVH